MRKVDKDSTTTKSILKVSEDSSATNWVIGLDTFFLRTLEFYFFSLTLQEKEREKRKHAKDINLPKVLEECLKIPGNNAQCFQHRQSFHKCVLHA